MNVLDGMRHKATFVLLLIPFTMHAQVGLEGLRPVKADLRPIVGAYYRYTPPGADWYYAREAVPGPPEARTTMLFRHARPDSLCLNEQVHITEHWVDRDHLLSDSTLFNWALANIAFMHAPDGASPGVSMQHEHHYGVDMGLRTLHCTTRLVNGTAYAEQTLCYLFRSPRTCVMPTYENAYAVQCRLVLIAYTRVDRADHKPDLSTDSRMFELLSLKGSEPY